MKIDRFSIICRERLRDSEQGLVRLRKENIGLMDTIGDLEAQVAIQVKLPLA